MVGNLNGQLSFSERLADGSFFADRDDDGDLNSVVGNLDGQPVVKPLFERLVLWTPGAPLAGPCGISSHRSWRSTLSFRDTALYSSPSPLVRCWQVLPSPVWGLVFVIAERAGGR